VVMARTSAERKHQPSRCCLHVQFTQPCSAHVPHDSVTRFLRASRARNTRTAALFEDSSFCSANTFTGVPPTSISVSASAYSGFNVAASRDTHAQISFCMSSDGASCASSSRAKASYARCAVPRRRTDRWPRCGEHCRTTEPGLRQRASARAERRSSRKRLAGCPRPERDRRRGAPSSAQRPGDWPAMLQSARDVLPDPRLSWSLLCRCCESQSDAKRLAADPILLIGHMDR